MSRQCDPVGAVEIATRLGVARRTVDSWRGRGTKGDPFPEPRWTVGGRPAWNWDDVERWHATRTN
jgi:predicted DNA-binding transcriptional regulator AlpA